MFHFNAHHYFVVNEAAIQLCMRNRKVHKQRRVRICVPWNLLSKSGSGQPFLSHAKATVYFRWNVFKLFRVCTNMLHLIEIVWAVMFGMLDVMQSTHTHSIPHWISSTMTKISFHVAYYFVVSQVLAFGISAFVLCISSRNCIAYNNQIDPESSSLWHAFPNYLDSLNFYPID